MGMGYGWLAPTIRRLRTPSEQLFLSDEQCSWLGSLHESGRILGTFVAGFLLDVFGRKMALTFSSIVYFLMWPSVAFANSVAILYVVRFVFGISAGINDVCSSIYVAENCSTRQRSIFGSITIACFYGGELLVFAICTYLPYRTAALTNAAIALLSLSTILWCTESPHFLIAKGKYAKAESNLRWLRGGRLEQSEFEELKRNVIEENAKRLSFQDFLADPVYWKTVLMTLGLSVLMMATGQASIVIFASVIFVQSEAPTPDEYTTIFGIWQFVAVCMSLLVVNRCNRKTLLIGSFVVMAATESAAAALYYVHVYVQPVPQFPWLIFAAVVLYATVFCVGVHPLSFVIRGEFFPQKIKAIGGAITITGISMTAFGTTKTFLLLADTFGMHVNFIIYAIFSVISALYVLWAIPETRGKTLGEIRKIMENW